VQQRLIREFDLIESQAYNVMRDVALEVFLAQPGYYVQSSLAGAIELFVGQDESLRLHLERLAVPRLRRDWQQVPELAALLPPPVPPEIRWQTLNRSIWASHLYVPSGELSARLLGTMFIVGFLAMVSRPSWRPALPIPMIVVTVLVLSSFLDGPVPRFRYPLDPFITLTAAGGLLGLIELARRAYIRASLLTTPVGQAADGGPPVTIHPQRARVE